MTEPFPPLALQLVSSGHKTFIPVNLTLSWSEAQRYCRLHHTDLADVQSALSLSGLTGIYSALGDTYAWIGLFYNEDSHGPSWSSGSVYDQDSDGLSLSSGSIFNPVHWTKKLSKGYCGTVKSVLSVPVMDIDACEKPKPFICYYGEVRIGQQTFTRFDREKTWLSAWKYCRKHYTDLADLQKIVDEADKQALKTITNETEAWIGLFFNVSSQSMSWSSGLGHYIPDWLIRPTFLNGMCAGLRTYTGFNPRVYAISCSFLQPFICFYDPTVGSLDPLNSPLQWMQSPEVTVGLTPGPSIHLYFLLCMGAFGQLIQEMLKLQLGHEQFRLKWVGFEVNRK
ncbi:putative C-type lectin domain family 20 member A [Rhynchocyon petersi]